MNTIRIHPDHQIGVAACPCPMCESAVVYDATAAKSARKLTMKRIEIGHLALSGDAYNWTIMEWIASKPGFEDKAPDTRADGARGRWRPAAFYGRLPHAVAYLHDELVRAANAGTLDALACAVLDAAGAIVAALDRLDVGERAAP